MVRLHPAPPVNLRPNLLGKQNSKQDDNYIDSGVPSFAESYGAARRRNDKGLDSRRVLRQVQDIAGMTNTLLRRPLAPSTGSTLLTTSPLRINCMGDAFVTAGKALQLIEIGVRDSKELTAKKREELEPQIKKIVDGFGIGEASVEEINNLGIVKATWLAMQRAVDKLKIKPDLIVVDGREIPKLSVTSDQLSVVRGDKIIPLISAASIIAKVYRDKLMSTKYQKTYPNYGFDRHKGYGTKQHFEKIKAFGLSSIHRTLFCGRIIR